MNRKWIVVMLMLLAVVMSGNTVAETLTLGEQDRWEEVSEGEGKYLLSVAEIKRLVDEGETKEVEKAVEKFREDYPDIAGLEFDKYMEGEFLLSKGKLIKAVKAFEGFTRLWPDSAFYDAALERLFSIGQAFLNGQKKKLLFFRVRAYEEGIRIMKGLQDRLGDAPMAKRAAVAIAESFENRKKYEEAYEQWSLISSKWPIGDLAQRSLLAMARNKHAGYRGPDFDQSDLVSAQSYYRIYLDKYPGSAKELKIPERLEMIKGQLAYKKYKIGEYYDNIDDESSAGFYYDIVVDEWPETKAAQLSEEAKNTEKKKEHKWYRKVIMGISDNLL